MSELFLLLLILLALLVFRKPIRNMLGKTKDLGEAVSLKTDIYAKEMNTETLKALQDGIDSGKIDLEAEKKLKELLRNNK